METEIVSVSLPTAEGEITVLPHHATLNALLVPGVIHLEKVDGGKEEVAVSTGFIQIDGGKVLVLADTAEQGHELELSVIAEAQERAQQVMREVVRGDDASFAAAAAGIQREMARYKVARRHHREKGLPLADRGEFPSADSAE